MGRGLLRVMVVTPSGEAGQGGIDRLYHYVRRFAAAELAAVADVRYVAARGGAPGALWAAAFPGRFLRFTVQVAAWRPDLIHLNFATGGSVYRKYALACVARLFGARVLLHFHGQFTPEEAARPSPMMRCLVRLCRGADLILALGTHYRHAFVDWIGLPPEKVAVLANGIPDFAADVALPKPSTGPVKLLFAGEVGARKGADLLVDALGRLAHRPGWTCTIAGNGDLAPYRARAEAAGVGDRVRFTGWVDSAEVHRLMRDSDVVVLPSRSEAMPLTLIEGACAGAALVATRVGEVSEVVTPGNGLMVEPDAEDLARAIGCICDHPEERARMQAASRRLYESRFALPAFVARLGEFYRQAMSARSAHGAPTSEISTSASS